MGLPGGHLRAALHADDIADHRGSNERAGQHISQLADAYVPAVLCYTPVSL